MLQHSAMYNALSLAAQVHIITLHTQKIGNTAKLGINCMINF